MKNILFLSFALAIFSSSCDVRKKGDTVAADRMQQAADAANAPTTVDIIDTVYNFGKVPEGNLVEYNYRFKNTGKNPLIIMNATASCGCTVPEKPDHAIQPGEIGYLKVKFDSKNRPGQAHKTITVSSNANPPFPPLVLEGEVIGKQNEE